VSVHALAPMHPVMMHVLSLSRPLSDPLAASIPRRRSAHDCWLTVTPPDHLDAPLQLTPSLACRNTMLCTPAQGRCAAREPEESRRRSHESGAAHLYLDTEPRSMCCVHACIHASSSTQISAFDDSQWTLARLNGWTDASGCTATRHTSQPRDWTGYDSEAGWPWEGLTMACETIAVVKAAVAGVGVVVC
jgi:hypothetical protein